MGTGAIILAIDIEWITPAPQYPPISEDVDSYEDILDRLIASGCVGEGLTYTKVECQCPNLGSDWGYFYEVTE